MSHRRIVGGKEAIILREDRWGGFECIEAEKLTMRMDEVFSEAALIELTGKVPMALAGLKSMTFIAFIKSDIAGKDIMGWKQHATVLREEGFDVGKDEMRGE